MSLSDIFSIPFLICLSLCILLIGCSSIFFYQKISQQDHKISSMIGLISSMAEENQALRLQFANAPGLVGGGGGGGYKNTFQESNDQPEKSNLISVSDDEDESSSEEEYSSDEDDNQSEDMDHDNDSDDEIETHVIKINSENLKISNDDITIFENIVSQPHEEEEAEEEEDSLSDDEVVEILEINIDDHTIDENEMDESMSLMKEYNHEHDHENLEPLDSLNVSNVENNIKSIHIDLEQMSSSTDEIKDISIFKSMNEIDVDGQSNQSQKVIDTADFKKMSINKLRELISKQGATDASKLKKNEILKLLGVEQ